MFLFLKNKIDYLSVFLLAFLFFSFLQSPQVLPDPDAFYHAKISEFLSEGKVVKEFPYLRYTTLNDGFVDHHFLYHLLLVPSAYFSEPLFSLKIVQALITSIFITIFYWFLKKENIKWPWFWTLVLAANHPFIFRTMLIKANSLSLIFLFVGMYFIFRKKYYPLLILSYLYVQAYGGWILILIIALVFALSKIIEEFFLEKKLSRLKKIFFKLDFLNLYAKKEKSKNNLSWGIKILFFSLGGILLGIIISPYFPQNLYFYFQQIFQIGIVNLGGTINVGGEWRPYEIVDLLSVSGPAFILFFSSLFLFFISLKKQNYKSLGFFILSLFFLGATLKSQRYVEYLIPFLIAFCAYAATLFFNDKIFKDMKYWALKFYGKAKSFSLLAITVFCLFFIFIIFQDMDNARVDLSRGMNLDYYKKASSFLADNSHVGDVIFHADWDDFPPLFYHNSKNHYIVGLDPTFMYNFNQDLYKEYADITMGNDRGDIYRKIKNKFGATFVFLDKSHLNFNDNLIRDKNFEFAYKDEDALVYRLK